MCGCVCVCFLVGYVCAFGWLVGWLIVRVCRLCVLLVFREDVTDILCSLTVSFVGSDSTVTYSSPPCEGVEAETWAQLQRIVASSRTHSQVEGSLQPNEVVHAVSNLVDECERAQDLNKNLQAKVQSLTVTNSELEQQLQETRQQLDIASSTTDGFVPGAAERAARLEIEMERAQARERRAQVRESELLHEVALLRQECEVLRRAAGTPASDTSTATGGTSVIPELVMYIFSQSCKLTLRARCCDSRT